LSCVTPVSSKLIMPNSLIIFEVEGQQNIYARSVASQHVNKFGLPVLPPFPLWQWYARSGTTTWRPAKSVMPYTSNYFKFPCGVRHHLAPAVFVYLLVYMRSGTATGPSGSVHAVTTALMSWHDGIITTSAKHTEVQLCLKLQILHCPSQHLWWEQLLRMPDRKLQCTYICKDQHRLQQPYNQNCRVSWQHPRIIDAKLNP